ACRRVNAAGIPLLRMHVAFNVLHPLYSGMGVTWSREAGTSHETYAHNEDEIPPETFQRSPHYYMMTHRIPLLRRRLTGPEALTDFPILTELRDLGGTDYLAFLVQFAQSDSDGILGSWLVDRDSGFTDREISALRRIQEQLAIAARMTMKTQLTENVVRTYLGQDAGMRVLSGKIRRGDGDTIPAAIWYSDLRGSTEMSETLSREAYTEVLNSYFNCMGGAVVDAGGEILDFIGDAMLAIFPIAENPDVGGFTESQACQACLAASRDAARRLAEVNIRRAAQNEADLSYGLALHRGEMMFGNIGTADRLSFSVIGPSVNQVARLQDMTKELGRPVLVSRAFADGCAGQFESLGEHRLSGVSQAMEILAPTP
ncbi:MAG: adenylate/guanylate cyclase domain-containing protein, partial [Pseudomonadota bacterium]